MHSSRSRTTRLVFQIAALIGCLVPLAPAVGQGASAGVVGYVRIAVPPVMQLRSVGTPRLVARRRDQLDAAVTLVADANAKYVLRARLGAVPGQGVRVFVQDAAGAFQRLVPGAAVSVAVEQQRGRTTHDVVCRLESNGDQNLDSGGCALTYDFLTVDGAMLLASTGTSP